ncbi:MAG: serine protease [Bacteroidota bacterium]|nr:serine protease [Bacteroidota bacterium]MDP4274175.1 serine protease [Bacteroidota bacterium]
MYRKVWKACHKAICCINFLSNEGITFYTLTGFKVGNLIISDEYIYKILKAKEVHIKFVESDGYTVYASASIPFWEFQDRILENPGDKKRSFVFIKIDGLGLDNVPSLKLSSDEEEIGQPLAVVGFQLGQQNLSIKSGIISSFFVDVRNSKQYIQFESTIRQGNSGSPLINVENNEVIGIVGHRLSTITQSYDQLMKVINKNLEVLKDVEGIFNFHDVDPIQVLIANQQQIKHLTKEYYQSASMRYGYATEIKEVTGCMA